jgi:[NiFe] hydrogenase diaphorase moiety large subunit
MTILFQEKKGDFLPFLQGWKFPYCFSQTSIVMIVDRPSLSKDRTHLLNYLWSIQNSNGYIRDEDVKSCASILDISEIELEGVISFYHFFHRKPAGKHIIYLNNSIVSEVKGFERIREAFERETGGRFGGVDPSGQFGLYETACIGLSDVEPAALIDFHPFTNLNSMKVRSIIASLKQGKDPAEICDEVPDHVRYKPSDDKAIFLRDYHPGTSVYKLPKMSPEAVIEEIKKSGLKGLGGAFFPTGLKWEFCRKEKDTPKYIICNADEGEPGTFKDRVLLQLYPGLILEGMIIAGYVTGATEGYVYLRAEYMWMKKEMEETIQYFRRRGLLGKDIAGIKGFDFDIRLQMGAGAYVCGEETALMNSLEGKRGEPRSKLSFPTEKGLFNKPTIINNVETFAAAGRIIELGAEHFLKTGTPDSPGTKLISVSGDCHLPGIYEIEWGTPVSELLEMCEADDPYFIQSSGPSGDCISSKEIHRKIHFKDLKCGGSFMIFNRNRDILEILRNFTDFFKHESCGICTPCRAGNFLVQRKLEKLKRGLAFQSDLDDIRKWGNIITVNSRCGLGKMSTNALTLALDKFPDYFHAKIKENPEGLNKAFDLEQAVLEYEKFKD